jgi:Holliday junction resolvase-like predicted endonuclease
MSNLEAVKDKLESPADRVRIFIENFRNAPLSLLSNAKVQLAHLEIALDEELFRRGGELDVEIEQEFDALKKDIVFVDDLLKGKIDNFAVYLEEFIPRKIEALEAAIQLWKNRAERLEDIAFEAVSANPEKKLEGEGWKMSMRKSTGTVIENPDQIPDMFKKGEVIIRVKFDPCDANARKRWTDFIEQNRRSEGFTGDIVLSPKASEIKEVILSGTAIEGARVEHRENLQIKPVLKKIKAKKTKEIEQ